MHTSSTFKYSFVLTLLLLSFELHHAMHHHLIPIQFNVFFAHHVILMQLFIISGTARLIFNKQWEYHQIRKHHLKP